MNEILKKFINKKLLFAFGITYLLANLNLNLILTKLDYLYSLQNIQIIFLIISIKLIEKLIFKIYSRLRANINVNSGSLLQYLIIPKLIRLPEKKKNKKIKHLFNFLVIILGTGHFFVQDLNLEVNVLNLEYNLIINTKSEITNTGEIINKGPVISFMAGSKKTTPLPAGTDGKNWLIKNNLPIPRGDNGLRYKLNYSLFNPYPNKEIQKKYYQAFYTSYPENYKHVEDIINKWSIKYHKHNEQLTSFSNGKEQQKFIVTCTQKVQNSNGFKSNEYSDFKDEAVIVSAVNPVVSKLLEADPGAPATEMFLTLNPMNFVLNYYINEQYSPLNLWVTANTGSAAMDYLVKYDCAKKGIGYLPCQFKSWFGDFSTSDDVRAKFRKLFKKDKYKYMLIFVDIHYLSSKSKNVIYNFYKYDLTKEEQSQVVLIFDKTFQNCHKLLTDHFLNLASTESNINNLSTTEVDHFHKKNPIFQDDHDRDTLIKTIKKENNLIKNNVLTVKDYIAYSEENDMKINKNLEIYQNNLEYKQQVKIQDEKLKKQLDFMLKKK